jgi:uncharacterized protein YndB with AHSA1/START domain
MTHDRIERDIHIKAPVERVWTVLTTPEHLAQWFSETAELDLRPGGRLAVGWEQHGTGHGVVETVDPPRFFAWRWAYAPGLEPAPGNSTLVEFTLTPEGDGTRLRIVETGFAALDLPVDGQRKHHEDNTGGWEFQGEKIRAYAEKL